MQNEKPSFYAIIPANVRYSDIIPNAKLLFGEITALSDREGYCWASNVYFGKLYKKNQTTVSEWIKILSDNGFIRIETDGHNRKIFITTPILREKPKEPSGKAEGEPSGKAETINTSKSIKKVYIAPETGAGKKRVKKEVKFTTLGADVLKAFESVDPKNSTYYENKTQRAAADFLIAQYGEEHVHKVISILTKTNKQPFFPKIHSPVDLKEKWQKLRDKLEEIKVELKNKTEKYKVI
jgi:hypothetical protein